MQHDEIDIGVRGKFAARPAARRNQRQARLQPFRRYAPSRRQRAIVHRCQLRRCLATGANIERANRNRGTERVTNFRARMFECGAQRGARCTGLRIVPLYRASDDCVGSSSGIGNRHVVLV